MFQLINGGYFTRHPEGFCLDRPLGFEHYVLLCIRSEAEIHIDNRYFYTSSDSFLLIPPHTPYRYANPNGSYMNDWLHFECDSKDIEVFPDSMWGIPFTNHNPSIIGTYIEQILWEKNFSSSSIQNENIHYLFQILFRHIANDFSKKNKNSYSPYRFQLQQHRLAMQSSPYLNHQAKEKADELGISLSYYEHLYKDLFGLSFRSDYIKMKIDYAKNLIKTTSMPLETIALECGYNSAVHFHRQFLSKTGITPGEYRKKNRLTDTLSHD